MIRRATPEDIPAILEMCAAYHAEVCPDLTYHPGAVAATIRALILQPQGLVLVGGEPDPCAFLMASVGPNPWRMDLVADLMVWWINVEARASAHRWVHRLMAEFENWALASGAACSSVAFTGKDASAFLTRRGYRPGDTRMVREFT